MHNPTTLEAPELFLHKKLSDNQVSREILNCLEFGAYWNI